jgi:hypothetical protein
MAACVNQALVKLQAAEDALSSARKDITDLQNQINTLKAEIVTDAKATNDRISYLKKNIDDNASKIDFSMKGEPLLLLEALVTFTVPALMGPVLRGQVLVGIKEEFGGTCHQQCDGDGRPVRNIKVICGQPSLAHAPSWANNCGKTPTRIPFPCPLLLRLVALRHSANLKPLGSPIDVASARKARGRARHRHP